MNKKAIMSLMLSAALCASQAQAMSRFMANLLPRARQIAAMVMNPSVRNALTQGERTIFSAARNGARIVPEVAQEARQPMAQSVSRSFATQASRAAQPAQQSRVGLAAAAGVGLAGVAGGTMMYVQPESQKNAFPKDFLTTTDASELVKMMKENPDYARQFTQLVTQENFKNIDPYILWYILNRYPESARVLTPYAGENIALLMTNGYGIAFLRSLIEKDFESAETLTHYADNNISLLVKSIDGITLLRRLIEKSPKSTKEWKLNLLHNTMELLMASDHDGLFLLDNFVNAHPELAQEFTSYIMLDFKLYFHSNHILSFLNKLIEKDVESAKILSIYAVQNFKLLVDDEKGRKFLLYTIENSPEVAEKCTLYAVQNFKSLIETEKGRGFLLGMIKNSPEVANKCTLYADQNIAFFLASYDDYIFLQKLTCNNLELEKKVALYAAQNLELVLDARDGRYIFKELVENNQELSKIWKSYVVEKIASLVINFNQSGFVEKFMAKNPEVVKEVLSNVINHFESFATCESGRRFLTQNMIYIMKDSELKASLEKLKGTDDTHEIDIWKKSFIRVCLNTDLTKNPSTYCSLSSPREFVAYQSIKDICINNIKIGKIQYGDALDSSGKTIKRFIHDFEIDPKGHGIGGSMLEVFCEESANEGIGIIELSPIIERIPFYKRHGFNHKNDESRNMFKVLQPLG